MKLVEGNLKNYSGLYSDKFRGKVFEVWNEKAEIGFVFFELFEINKNAEGTFHSFILPSVKISGYDFIRLVFKTAFETLKLTKLYTMAEAGMKKALSKFMENTEIVVNGKTVFIKEK